MGVKSSSSSSWSFNLLQIVWIISLLNSTLSSPVGFSSKQDHGNCTTQQFRHRFHFSPLRNWSNDPNGMVYYDGVYHLFFQYHPYSTQWGPMHWGHAISRDMLIWEEVDIALYPDEVGFIFSGSSVVDKMNTTGFKSPNSDVDPIIAIYTSASGENNWIQRQSIAYSLDKGMTFTPYEHNPVLVNPNERDFRDPKVSFVLGTWVMVLAVQNRVEFFSSPNLKDWTLESEFGRDPSEGVHEGTWECPDLLEFEVEVGGEMKKLFVLVVSVGSGGANGGSGTHYFVGNLTRNDNNKIEFHSYGWQDSQWLDWGPDSYAGVTFSNLPDNRNIFMAWMTNLAYSGSIPTTTWRGQMTIPKQLSLVALNDSSSSDPQYRLISTPITEFQNLRNPFQHFEVTQSFKVPPQTLIPLTELTTFSNPSMELEVTLNISGSPQFSICAYNSENEEICFGLNGTQWYLDRSKSGNTDFHDMMKRVSYAKREVQAEVINIKLLLDVSSLEVFAHNGLVTMTALHYPSKPFDKFYINHWSRASSPSTLVVQKLDIWGILCWYPESE